MKPIESAKITMTNETVNGHKVLNIYITGDHDARMETLDRIKRTIFKRYQFLSYADSPVENECTVRYLIKENSTELPTNRLRISDIMFKEFMRKQESREDRDVRKRNRRND